MAYRERIKISQMTPKGANLEATDLLEVSTIESGSYVTKSITGEEIINAASGGSQDLQSVTDNGNTTTNNLIVSVDNPIDNTTISDYFVTTQSGSLDTYTTIDATNGLKLKLGDDESLLKNTNVTNPNVILEFPNKASGSYTIATTSDIPSVSGFVPYIGATADVNLGTFDLEAAKGTFSHNGSTDTLTANHTSGSGIGLSITKGGNNEGLKVNKTSGSGNAATIIGTLEATTLVKTGGLATQFLMANGTTSLADIIFTIELVDALTVDFYAPYNLKINTVTNVFNAPTTTILDDGVAYTLTNTIAIGSKVTVTVDIASVVNLNIVKA
jgi:hypothetical protein